MKTYFLKVKRGETPTIKDWPEEVRKTNGVLGCIVGEDGVVIAHLTDDIIAGKIKDKLPFLHVEEEIQFKPL